jgi:hypothetical protein
VTGSPFGTDLLGDHVNILQLNGEGCRNAQGLARKPGEIN